MKILIVEDEAILLDGMSRVVQNCEPRAQIFSFETAAEALQETEKTAFDIAFLDIEMQDMNGVTLAGELKKRLPGINIIFCTAYAQYADRAMALHASGYILKPVTEAKVRRELEDLRHPVPAKEAGLVVQAFGNFEVFFQGKPLAFRYAKTKEMLAYLIDRKGALVSANEIQAVLWEDSSTNKSSYYKQLRKDLSDVLRMIGCEQALVLARGALAIVPEQIVCDYYAWLKQTPQERKSYHGEYMQQYSWAEATHGNLEMRDEP